VVVTNVPDYCLDEVADHAMALLLCLARKLTQLDGAVRDGTAVKDGQWNTLGLVRPVHRLGQQTLGIVGLGQIGRRVAQRARAFGMQVIAAPDPAVGPEQAAGLGVTMLPLEQMLAEADFVTLHCPLTPDTRALINARTIAQMKPAAMIVNTSRGPLISEAALVEALRSRRLAGAGLDVYEREPLAPDSPLRALPNVVLTSHAAWYSEEAIRDTKVKAAQSVADVLQGRVPRYILNPAALAVGRK
jgi:D-3-phosphoglycerate dehydrogenase